MKLQTQIPLKKSDRLIGYDSQLLLLGSCFSDNIGSKFQYFKFRAQQNPFGILFHPVAIENLIVKAKEGFRFTTADLICLDQRWHCFDTHSDLTDTSENALLERLNSELEQTKVQLRSASHIIITLGTAWVYRQLLSNKIVANCHKVPQKDFSKELLTGKEIVESLENILNAIRSLNKKAAVIFTVSPVRHLKDGFIENQRSKSHLISAVHHSLKTDNVFYFPAYEIMMDELRDYRFYKEDMVHPNEVAINYIWEYFQECWINVAAIKFMEKVGDVQKGLQHIPFNPDSDKHQEFVKKLEQKIAYLQNAYPHIRF